jgi:hypothetical protein
MAVTEDEVYNEELERHNEMSRLARELGYCVPMSNDPPPALNSDGSLKRVENKYFDAADAVALLNFNPNHGEGGRFAASHEETHSLEHVGHEIHHAHEVHEIAEVLGHGGHAQTAHDAMHAASAHDIHDVIGIGVRHVTGDAVKLVAAGIAAVPGGRKIAEGITKAHDWCEKKAEDLTAKLEERYGRATAAAVLGSGAIAAAGVRAGVGLSGPAGKAIPGQKFLGALPLVPLLEAGRAAGLIGPGTALEKHIGTAAKWIHAVREAIGKPVGKFKAGLDKTAMAGARGAGFVAGKILGTNEDLDIDKIAQELIDDLYDGYKDIIKPRVAVGTVNGFNSEQLRGDDGRFVTMYHGTTKEHADSIKKDGYVKKPNEDQPIFLTPNKEEAKSYANAMGKSGTVFEFKVPKSSVEKHVWEDEDDMDEEERAYAEEAAEHTYKGETLPLQGLWKDIPARGK